MNRREIVKQIKFLENHLDKLKNDQLTEDEQKRLSEFVIQESYLNSEKGEDKEQLKYFALGWYIYENYLSSFK